jgi:CHAT domain-containing protein
VPDGILWELPFQALQTGANRYLIENVAIYYAPSLTALSEMSRRQIRTGPESLLAFANPRIDNKTFSDLKGVVRGDVLAPLPEAETEVKALKRIWNPNKIFIGPSAEEREFKARASNYRFIHFATHGILDDINPMYSRLLLSRDVNDANDDGLLEAREIMRMNLSAELVVLSACETAQGRVGTGEGMIGMSWAFMMAGVPTVVASQWKVDSATTSELMIKFHRQLKNQYSIRLTGKSQALRQASLALMKVARYKHPFFWAGFVVIGDGG